MALDQASIGNMNALHFEGLIQANAAAMEAEKVLFAKAYKARSDHHNELLANLQSLSNYAQNQFYCAQKLFQWEAMFLQEKIGQPGSIHITYNPNQDKWDDLVTKRAEDAKSQGEELGDKMQLQEADTDKVLDVGKRKVILEQQDIDRVIEDKTHIVPVNPKKARVTFPEPCSLKQVGTPAPALPKAAPVNTADNNVGPIATTPAPAQAGHN